MSEGMHNCENSMMVRLMVMGKYVRPRRSMEPNKAELFLVEEQGSPDDVKCFTSELSTKTEGVTKKCVAFHFKYGEEADDKKWYSLKTEGETLTLDLLQPVNDACSFVQDWLEKVDIKGGKSHHLRTAAGLIGVIPNPEKKSKLCVGGSPVEIEQVRNS